ncbi:hypothetical protein BACFIN_08280 [Bacteroides finegoldii DSM 17565]|nr:hypothetical protein BACFIN_08280 [Bacteroides finegoldii DSM 17565]
MLFLYNLIEILYSHKPQQPNKSRSGQKRTFVQAIKFIDLTTG